MTVTKLAMTEVKKPWGRNSLPAPFATKRDARIGEIWFPAPDGLEMPLLVKYLFTSEKLSIQVHPDDDQARGRGLSSGKEECWYILDAEPGATLGMGTVRSLSADELRTAALSGEIEQLVQWHPVKAGMLFHIPPGTVHAIGPGVSLIEVQQNIDITYRLYDYGRPRELHLEDAVAVSRAEPFSTALIHSVNWDRSRVLLQTPHFALATIVGDDCSSLASAEGCLSIIPVEGQVIAANQKLSAGEAALADARDPIGTGKGARAFVAWPTGSY